MKPTYFDLTVRNVGQARIFFERVLGWRFEKFPMPYEYYRVQAGPADEPLPFNQLPHEVEPQPRATNVLRARTSPAVKPIEDARQLIRRNAQSLVGYPDFQRRRLP